MGLAVEEPEIVIGRGKKKINHQTVLKRMINRRNKKSKNNRKITKSTAFKS